MATKKTLTENDIVSKFMDTVLFTEKHPESIYKFAKDLEIEEAEFYQFFTSFEALEQRIFTLFFTNAHEVLAKNKDYEKYPAREKILSLYFTLIEIFTANRSYVLHSLDNESPLKNLKKLSGLKHIFQEYVRNLELEKLDLKQEKIQKFQDKSIEELFWIQFLMIIKFWMDDSSTSFEKTDLFIEKSVQASFDLMNTRPAKSILDFGKFIFKEKMKFN